MTKALVVIGANYGDEGKGAAVHFLAKTNNVKDIFRFNGGAQAGHTVQLANGRRHVFHCFGSGTLTGAITWYTWNMLVNPVAMFEERLELLKLRSEVSAIMVHPDCIVVTPWDIALNQFKEIGRGTGRHGSVGHGINEATVRHHQSEAPTITADQLSSPTLMNGFMKEAEAWYRAKIKEAYGAGEMTGVEPGVNLLSPEILSKMSMLFLRYYPCFASSATVFEFNEREVKPEVVIFEGAQGLLLDQNNEEHFPYVTRSNTGLRNVVDNCIDERIDIDTVYYVTRPYITRHGAGPILAGVECSDQWTLGQDKTNKANDFQGSIRYGHLYWGSIKERIEKDLTLCNVRPKVKVIVTCMDQLSNQDTYFLHERVGKTVELDAMNEELILAKIREVLGFEVISLNGLKEKLG